MKKNKKIIISVILIISIAVTFYFIGSNKYDYECFDTYKVITIWNNKTATSIGITPEIMYNLTYAYLDNLTLFCPDNIQDCFLEKQLTQCCFELDDKKFCRYENGAYLSSTAKEGDK